MTDLSSSVAGSRAAGPMIQRQGLTMAVAQSVSAPRDVEANVVRHLRQVELAAEHGAQLLLFPELSLTGYGHDLTAIDALAPTDPRLEPLREASEQYGMIVVAGAPTHSPIGLQISSLCWMPGQPGRIHGKEYLHPGEEATFVPGRGGEPLRVGAELVALAICADVTHPEHAGNAAACGATVYAASCFLPPEGYRADARLLELYARQHRLLVLMANSGAPIADWASAGRSAIWDDCGEVLARAPAAGEALVLAQYDEAGWSGKTLAG